MASKIAIRGSKVACVYDDRFIPLLQALGTLEIVRASNVEYNPFSKTWEAEHLDTTKIIASGPNRNDVITKEIKWLEENTI
jgi:hypothetical protein